MQNHILKMTRTHARRCAVSSFYYLTLRAYQLLCQVVYQVSHAIVNDDSVILPVLQHQVGFIYLLYCIYYGVEHYMMVIPKRIEQVPAQAIKLSFTKALNKLGQVLANKQTPIPPCTPNGFTMPSGGNLLEVNYHTEEDLDAHVGVPFDRNRKYTLHVEITVHTFEMYPVVTREGRASYIKNRLPGDEKWLQKMVLPPREDNPNCKWLKNEIPAGTAPSP